MGRIAAVVGGLVYALRLVADVFLIARDLRAGRPATEPGGDPVVGGPPEEAPPGGARRVGPPGAEAGPGAGSGAGPMGGPVTRG